MREFLAKKFRYFSNPIVLHRLNRVANNLLALVAVATLLAVLYLISQQQRTLAEIQRLSMANQDKLETIVSPNLVFDKNQNVLRNPAVFYLDEPVVVEATFRNDTDKSISFTGVVQWELVTPNNTLYPIGTSVLQFEFTETIDPGCRELRFENRPPEQVREITQSLFNSGFPSVTWKILGDNKVESGASVSFEVERFSYIPRELPLPEHQNKTDQTTCGNI